MPLTRIGSELFINRSDTTEQLRHWVRQMHEAGLSLIRLFNFWDLCEPRRGVWVWDQFDAVFDAAADYGMGVVPTPFAQTPPGWMRAVESCQSVGDLEDPEFRTASDDYLGRLVSRYASHPALDSWIVWNEASIRTPINPATVAKFRIFLRRYYGGDIERLNRVYYERLRSFDDVNIEASPSSRSSPIAVQVKELDWHRFCVDYLMTILTELRDIIRETDPVHPIHVNPYATAKGIFFIGQNVWREGDIFDFIGSSAHPVHHSERFRRDRVTQSMGYFASLMRSATRDPSRKFWVSELQGGPAIFSGAYPGSPRPEDIRAWLWESIGQGAEGIIYWTFNGRTHGGEAGEWMLLDQEGAPSRRLLETTRIIETLSEHAGLFGPSRPPTPTIGVLYSESSMMMPFCCCGSDDVRSSRNRHMVSDALVGAYSVLDDLGFDVDFIGEERLTEAACLDGFKLLLLPDCMALQPTTHDVLLRFVAAGGSIIADGLTGWKTPTSFIDRENADKLTSIFGASLRDIEPSDSAITFVHEGRAVPGWFSEITLRPTDAVPLVMWDAERVGVTRWDTVAGGVVIRIGTHLFQRYFAFQEIEIRDFIGRVVPGSITEPLRLLNASHTLRLRRLTLSDGYIGILINTSDMPQTARLSIPGGYCLVRLGGDAMAVDRANLATVEVAPHDVILMQIRKGW